MSDLVGSNQEGGCMILHETLADDLLDTLAVNIEALRTKFNGQQLAGLYVIWARRAEVIANDLAVLHDLLVAIRDEQAAEAAELTLVEDRLESDGHVLTITGDD